MTFCCFFVWCFIGFFFPFSGKEQGYAVRKPLEKTQYMAILHKLPCA